MIFINGIKVYVEQIVGIYAKNQVVAFGGAIINVRSYYTVIIDAPNKLVFKWEVERYKLNGKDR